jgi:hypothetical protein
VTRVASPKSLSDPGRVIARSLDEGRRYVARALIENGGHLRRTSFALGIHRSTMFVLLRKLGLSQFARQVRDLEKRRSKTCTARPT